MHRAQNLVAIQRGFDRDFRRLGIADFTNHDDVRVLAQDRAQRVGESQPNFFFDRHLVDAWHLEFDRVLDSNNVKGRVVQLIKRRIQRGGLARTGGAGDQDQAVGRIDRVFELLKRIGVQAEFVDARREI